ncbi:lasso peptide biosynthesis B2 protein [Kitasatospora sp. NPDC056184]|uniref:lasso peptide biosynthesis B2 protein n=1 Tax=Kitasatospora sp. NPDC056184 TaxID=3345738 RepID=UPI0035DF9BFD
MAAAAAGFALALLVLRCLPIRTTIAVARSAARFPGRTAHAGQARNLFEAVSAVGRRWPGRSACLEESLGTYLAAALLGRRLQWVLGARFAPNGERPRPVRRAVRRRSAPRRRWRRGRARGSAVLRTAPQLRPHAR